MPDPSPELLTFVMLAGVFAVVLIGFPLAISVGMVGLAVGYFVFGDAIAGLIYNRVFAQLTNYTLAAIPAFVFMGTMLERSGITTKLYDALYLWLGGLRGGLAIITVLIGTILAACVGIIGASVAMLTLVALPSMLQRQYDKGLAAGAVCAGGTLGILIPPSIMLVVYAPMAMMSVGKLFMGAILPGLLLSGLYCGYIALRCFLQPQAGPAIPPEDRGVPFMEKTALLVKSVAPPVILIFAVLGTIFFGIAPPTEAAGIGALVATILTVAYRRFNWQILKGVSLTTMQLTSMILLIAACCFAFVGVFIGAGCGDVVKALVLAAPGGRWGSFLAVMVVVFLLGFFVDWIGIVFIVVPIISPLTAALGFDPVWFAIMICINLQMSFMTPPLAPAIFFMQGSLPNDSDVRIGDIVRGVLPFVGLIVAALVLCAVFPGIIQWLPSQMVA